MSKPFLFTDSFVKFLKSSQNSLILGKLLQDGREVKFLISIDLSSKVSEFGSTEEFSVEILASMSIRAVSLQKIFLTGLCLVVGMEM